MDFTLINPTQIRTQQEPIKEDVQKLVTNVDENTTERLNNPNNINNDKIDSTNNRNMNDSDNNNDHNNVSHSSHYSSNEVNNMRQELLRLSYENNVDPNTITTRFGNYFNNSILTPIQSNDEDIQPKMEWIENESPFDLNGNNTKPDSLELKNLRTKLDVVSTTINSVSDELENYSKFANNKKLMDFVQKFQQHLIEIQDKIEDVEIDIEKEEKNTTSLKTELELLKQQISKLKEENEKQKARFNEQIIIQQQQKILEQQQQIQYFQQLALNSINYQKKNDNNAVPTDIMPKRNSINQRTAPSVAHIIDEHNNNNNIDHGADDNSNDNNSENDKDNIVNNQKINRNSYRYLLHRTHHSNTIPNFQQNTLPTIGNRRNVKFTNNCNQSIIGSSLNDAISDVTDNNDIAPNFIVDCNNDKQQQFPIHQHSRITPPYYTEQQQWMIYNPMNNSIRAYSSVQPSLHADVQPTRDNMPHTQKLTHSRPHHHHHQHTPLIYDPSIMNGNAYNQSIYDNNINNHEYGMEGYYTLPPQRSTNTGTGNKLAHIGFAVATVAAVVGIAYVVRKVTNSSNPLELLFHSKSTRDI